MDVFDLVALPIYLGIIYFFASLIRGKNAGNRLYQRYFIKGLNYKVIGALGYTLIYWFYYKGGDSIGFFHTITPTYKLFLRDPQAFFSFTLSSTSIYPPELWYDVFLKEVTYLTKGSASVTTIKIGSLINLFCFNSFIALVLLLAFFSYLFIWKVFELFVSLYPVLEKELAIGFLMLPSMLFWGSGIGKDVIVFSAIMNLIYCFYNLVIKRKSVLKNVLSIAVTAYLISLIRSYILFTIGPSLIIMAMIYYRNSFRSTMVRFIALPIFLLAGAGGSYYFIKSVGSSTSTYSVESLQKTAEGFHSWHTTLGQTTGGSFYSLGDDVDYSPTGILKKAPLALAITLFGPFFWQIRNPVMLMSGVESILFLFFFIRVFFSVKVYKTYSILFSDHILMLCMIFVIILGIAIGMTSFNYGALVRYKLPILPFFVTFLAVANFKLTGKGLLKRT